MNSFLKNVFVINRSIDKERMKTTHDILTRNQINYSRFEAITIDHNTSHMTDEIIGCGMSHMHIWNHVVSNNLKSAVIFEDDIFLKEDWKTILNIALKELPDDWDILTLGNTGIKFKFDKYETPFHFIFYNIISLLNLGNKKYNNTSFHNITIPYFFTGAYGYAISNNGAKKLLNLINDINFHIDVLMSSHSKLLNIYSLNNDIVYQRSEKSTISKPKPLWEKNKYKIHLNLFNDSMKDNKNVSYNYYMNVPVYRIFFLNKEFIINGWFLLIFIFILLYLILFKL